jgi:hypothetical protein
MKYIPASQLTVSMKNISYMVRIHTIMEETYYTENGGLELNKNLTRGIVFTGKGQQLPQGLTHVNTDFYNKSWGLRYIIE